MVTEGPAEVLRDRRDEREALRRLLEAVRRGQSRVLVVSGEPGVGKTALLESAISSASGIQVMRAAGVESEMELAFAALQQLCAPMLDRLDRLPAPQQDALAVAFGQRTGDAPDRFLVGLAVLSLFSEVAEELPLVCVVDDAQWLDRASAQALVFVARRLLAESVALLFATRDPSEELTGFQELRVEGLRDGDARALLGSVLRVPLDERVRERIVAETRGNPLALLELPRGLTPAELAGGFGLLDAPGLSGRIEDSFQRRFERLPAETQRLLLVAAAEPVGDPVLVWRAAGQLAIGVEAAADTDGLLEIGASVTFRHPLVRSAVYRAASSEERQAVHRALADATDPEVDPDRRAWHLAQATPGLDESVAAELERSAGRAQSRGGWAATAAFLERATVLTPEPSRRATRALAAAQAKHQAGAFDAALRLAAIAESGPLNDLQRAQVDLLRAQIAFALDNASDAPPLLLKAAKRLEPLDQRLARETYLDALTAVLFPAHLVPSERVLETARSASAAPPSSQPPRPSDLLLDGLTVLITDGYAAATPTLKRAVNAFRHEDIPQGEGRRWLWLACRVATSLWDDEAWDAISARFVQLARDAGNLSVLPLALTTRTGMHLFAGRLPVASSLVEEVAAVNEATGSNLAPYAGLALAAFQGREAEGVQVIEAATREVVRRGEGQGLTFIHWATALLYNGVGRYEEALAAAQQATEDSLEVRVATWVLVESELIEAAARSGKPEPAAEALRRLSEMTSASGTDWALGVEARSRALLSEGEAAEKLYRQAIEALKRTRVRVELGRARLLYGEWLRRERRRLDAREQLRTAHELFTEFGMEAFAERARVELRATGEHPRKRTVETRDDLTPQEAQISRLAADGATNQEIAAQLFISPSTVDYHLRKAFRKL
ncbi:MAG TPA: AAA family ATPase, partial [Solirubrobacteraceae bacterium]|nr:AAA family ATPase [Solirubrobacteraceae bacterium]